MDKLKPILSKTVVFVFCLIITLISLYPLNTFATDKKKVKVGWFESSFYTKDSYGRRSGYAYEYLQKIANYTGWEYEYVEGNWTDLFQMLVDGKIDVLPDISFSEERAKEMLFSSLQMGTENYYAFVSSENKEINGDDYSSFNGKKVGLISNSIQEMFWMLWAQQHNIEATVVRFDGSVEEAHEQLMNGQIDVFIYSDYFTCDHELMAVCQIGTSDLFFGINNKRKDIQVQMDTAMNKIFNENYNFNQDLYEKYIRASKIKGYLSVDEREWLEKNKTIRIGYKADYLPLCEQDTVTGEVNGVLKRYIEYASGCMNNAKITFEAKPFYSIEDAIDSLNNGEIDCVFPVNLSTYDAEQMGLVVTSKVMKCDMYFVTRDKFIYSGENEYVFAVSNGNVSLETYIKDNYPNSTIKYYENSIECANAIAKGEVDCTLALKFRLNIFLESINSNKLSTMEVEHPLELGFALKKGNNELYSILGKIINVAPDDIVTTALVEYSVTDKKIIVLDFIRDNLVNFICLVAIVIFIILVLLFISVKSTIKSRKSEKDALLANDKITALSEDQQAQIEEIIALNTQLQDNQDKLETSASELEEQLDNVTSLNKELTNTQTELEVARIQAESANDAKTAFLNNMSHDIRTPMNAILGFAQLMEKNLNNPDIMKDYLGKMQESGNYLLSIINNVLDMSRIDSGKIVLNETIMDLCKPDISSLLICFEEARRKNISLTSKTDLKNQYVYADSARTQQITVNLISNAVKYTPEGGHVDTSFVEIPSDREGYGKYVLTVKDDGIGMSKEFQSQIFEAFSRERTTTESKVFGTGLGMAIVKKLVDLMEGTIEIESEIGKGTCFTVTISHRIADAPDKKEIEHDVDNIDLTGKRILLVEDNEMNAEIALEILGEFGVSAERACDGIECLEMYDKAEDNYFDLILMDIQMPNMDGYETTKRIRNMSNKSKANIPIIAMTANAFDEDRRRSEDAGMNAHLTKPVNINKLKEVIASIVR